MGAAGSAPSRELLAAREALTAAQLAALEAAFEGAEELSLEQFQARVGPGGRLGERLHALLASQAHVPEAARRLDAPGALTLEALTLARATLDAGTDEEVAAFGALLLPRGSGVEGAAELVADMHAAVFPDAPPGVPAEARAIAAGAAEQPPAAWLRQLPAALRTLRGSLATPRAPPWAPPTLDWRGAPPLLMHSAWAWLLASSLPPGCQARWTLLFASEAHGRSFSTLFGRAGGRGAVLALVRDTAGGLAAGFCDAPLVKRADFFGGYSCLLAALLPAARVYKPTGNNDHMAWCAHGFESVPNGIGFGGQVNHFGLFVDASMEEGHSRFAATYANAPVLGSGDPAGRFQLDALELWSVDADALAEAEAAATRAARRAAGGGSVLDRFAQDRSFLKTALDRGTASDGVR